MNKNVIEPAFRDTFFINRLHLTSEESSLCTPKIYPSSPKIARSTYTNKIIRQQKNKDKLIDFHQIFQNQVQKHEQNKQPTKEQLKGHSGFNTSIDSVILPSKNNSPKVSCDTSRNGSALPRNCYVSRNVYNQNIHMDLSKSGILLEQLDEIETAGGTRKPDPRYFLKNLTIKGNPNLYRGNFTKFQKREIGRCRKATQLAADSQLSPWQNDRGHASQECTWINPR